MHKKTLTLFAVAVVLAWATPSFAQADVTYQGYQWGFVDNQPSQDSRLDNAILRFLGLNTPAEQKSVQKKPQPKKQNQPKKQAPAKKPAQPKKPAPAKPQQKRVQPDISPSVTQGGWHSII